MIWVKVIVDDAILLILVVGLNFKISDFQYCSFEQAFLSNHEFEKEYFSPHLSHLSWCPFAGLVNPHSPQYRIIPSLTRFSEHFWISLELCLLFGLPHIGQISSPETDSGGSFINTVNWECFHIISICFIAKTKMIYFPFKRFEVLMNILNKSWIIEVRFVNFSAGLPCNYLISTRIWTKTGRKSFSGWPWGIFLRHWRFSVPFRCHMCLGRRGHC